VQKDGGEAEKWVAEKCSCDMPLSGPVAEVSLDPMFLPRFFLSNTFAAWSPSCVQKDEGKAENIGGRKMFM